MLAKAAAVLGIAAGVSAWGSGGAAWTDHGADRMMLSEQKNLVMYSGRMTAARRVSPVPQVACHGPVCHTIDYVQCENMGSAGHGNIQWKCTAYPQIDARYTLADVEVGCEGYQHRGDPWVLAGSCGVSFGLKDRGPRHGQQQGYGGGYQQHTQQRPGYQHHDYNKRPGRYSTYQQQDYGSHSSSSGGGSAWIVFIVLAALIAYFLFRPTTPIAGGGGGAPHGAPPPQPPRPSAQTGYHPSADGFHHRPPKPSDGSGWGTPFVGGLAAGGAMGYMAGQAMAGGQHHYGGGGHGDYAGVHNPYAGSGGPPPGSSSNEQTHSATGFGGTNNR